MGKRKYGEHIGERRLKLKQVVGGNRRRVDEEEDMYGFILESDSIDMESNEESHRCEWYDTDENSDNQGSSNNYSRSMSPYLGRRSKLDLNREHSRRRKEKVVDDGRSEAYRRGKKKVEGPTKGSVVKARNAVVRTQTKWCRKAPTVICRVEMFKEKVLKYLDRTRKEEIREMGFGGFLHMKINHIPRQLCYWIMSRVHSSGLIQFGDEHKLKLAPVQIQCVFGLPMGHREVPKKVCKDDPVMMKRMSDITREYRKGGCDRDSVSIDKAIAVLTSVEVDEEGTPLPLVTAEEKLQYRTAFLIVILGTILCPLTRWGVLSKKARAAVTVARNADRYDWCTFVYDWLMDCVSAFAYKFDEDGFVPGCGGCSLFLLVFYLDHLNRPPVRWGVSPRIKVWTQQEVSKAVKEDKRRTSSDYGKLECLPVAYGDDSHPFAVKDSSTTLVQKVASEVVKLLTPHLQKLVSDTLREQNGGEVTGNAREKFHRDSPSGSERILNSSRRLRRFVYFSDDEGEDDTLHKVRGVGVSAHGPRSEQYANLNGLTGLEQTDKGGKVGCEEDPERGKESVNKVGGNVKLGLGPCDPIVEDINEHSCSTPQQHTPSLQDNAGDRGQDQAVGQGEDLVEKQQISIVSDVSSQAGGVHRTKEKRPVKETSAVGVSSVRQSVLDKRFLDCCRQWRLVKDGGEGCELIKCNKNYATQRDCYGVLMVKDFTSNGYVRMAADLYSKRWEMEQFVGKSRRILMSPDFATRAISPGNDPDQVAAQTLRVMPKVPVSEIKVIFVPVLRDEHWWCVAFDLNAKSMWIIDSIYSDSWKDSQTDSERIVQAFDNLFAVMDSEWVKGQMGSWSRRQVEITTPLDHRCCGVVMLTCIKACADRFKAKWGLPEKIPQARMRLLLDDAMSEFNELKSEFDKILPPDNRKQQKVVSHTDSPKRTSPRLSSPMKTRASSNNIS